MEFSAVSSLEVVLHFLVLFLRDFTAGVPAVEDLARRLARWLVAPRALSEGTQHHAGKTPAPCDKPVDVRMNDVPPRTDVGSSAGERHECPHARVCVVSSTLVTSLTRAAALVNVIDMFVRVVSMIDCKIYTLADAFDHHAW